MQVAETQLLEPPTAASQVHKLKEEPGLEPGTLVQIVNMFIT